MLKRASDAAMNATDGATLTLAFKPVANTSARSYYQRSGTNVGYVFQLDATGTAMNLSLGTGAARTTTKLANYALGTVYVLCVTMPNDGSPISVNLGGTVTTPTPSVINWQGASTSNLLIGYTTTSEIYYAALHTCKLDAQEQSNQVAYAKSILKARGLVT